MYVADTGNNKIVQISMYNGIVTNSSWATGLPANFKPASLIIHRIIDASVIKSFCVLLYRPEHLGQFCFFK